MGPVGVSGTGGSEKAQETRESCGELSAACRTLYSKKEWIMDKRPEPEIIEALQSAGWTQDKSGRLVPRPNGWLHLAASGSVLHKSMGGKE